MSFSDISLEREDGCLIRGNPSRFLGPALVAFLDILGMSRAILENWGADTDSALHRLLRIKTSIPRDDEKTQITLCICDPMTNKEFERYLSITRTLSDSMVTMLALPSKCRWQEFFMRVHSVLLSVRLIWQQSLREGFTIRGAVEFGEMFWDETEFTGPGLIRAHELESQRAITSRVLLGPALASKIVEFTPKGIPFSHPSSPINSFVISTDERIIIDPHFLVGQELLHLLKQLRQNAGEAKCKYDEIIEILTNPKENARRPTLAEMYSYIQHNSPNKEIQFPGR